eukprot:Tamp_19622.p1 GENE.Tamp_19622~~Tamp_19622.p1  ORF type:complete len:224 (+),score=22.00 Tamp_19622:540-1211(+)
MHHQISEAILQVRQHLKKHGAFAPGSCTWPAAGNDGDSHSRRRAPSHPPTQTPSSPHSCVHSEPPPSPPSAHHPSNPLRDASAGEGEGGGERGLKTTRLVRVRVKFQRKEAAMMELVVPRHDDSKRGKCETCVHFFREVSSTLQVHLDSMKLICKGQKLTAANLHTVEENGLILCLGKAMQDATGCDERDIQCLIAQLGLDRDASILLLKRHDFDLVDAMLHS